MPTKTDIEISTEAKIVVLVLLPCIGLIVWTVIAIAIGFYFGVHYGK